MGNRKIAARQIADAHLASTDRGARLLAACDGDLEHAERIDAVLGELDSRPLAPVISMPTSFACTVDEPGGARPYDLGLDGPLERRSLLDSWLVAVALGVALWAIIAAIAYGVAAALT